MTRWIFPEDRFTYSYYENTPIYPVVAGSTLTIYLDASATSLADIQTLAGQTIAGSVLHIGEDTLVPQFLGPDNVFEVWGKPEGTAQTYPMEAAYGPRLTNIVTQGGMTEAFADTRYAQLADFNTLSDTVAGMNAGKSYVHNQDVPATEWIVHHNLGYYPNVALVDTSGEEIESEIQYLDINTVRVEHYFPVGGNAYCS